MELLKPSSDEWVIIDDDEEDDANHTTKEHMSAWLSYLRSVNNLTLATANLEEEKEFKSNCKLDIDHPIDLDSLKSDDVFSELMENREVKEVGIVANTNCRWEEREKRSTSTSQR